MLKKLISHPVEQALQEAIQSELYASNLYKHLANQCQRLGLFGAAKYFHNESADELTHYQRISDYLNDRGSVAEVPAIEACDESVTTLGDALNAAYDAEADLGSKYEKWYKAVDPTTQQFLLQFLEIQRISIGEYGDLLSRLNLAGDDRCAILIIDAELGAK
ncbi:MAG: ferritin-like domain-containing protein [Methylobacter sp.]